MSELIVFGVLPLLAGVLAGVLAAGWWKSSRRDSDQVGDARSAVTAGPDGTMTVIVVNPGPEPVVVSAYARASSRLQRFGRQQIRRGRNQRERRSSSRTARQLLGSVAAGGTSTWTVVADTSTRPVCRVVLSLYQTNGRVRVHETVVRTEPGFVEVGLSRRRAFARPKRPADPLTR